MKLRLTFEIQVVDAAPRDSHIQCEGFSSESFDDRQEELLFIGHPKAGQRSAILYTIIENCRLCEINPLEHLCDVMPKIMDGSRLVRSPQWSL